MARRARLALVVPDAQPLPAGQRRLIWILGLGAFGLAWSITTVAAYLPPLLGDFTDSTHADRARSRRRGCVRLLRPAARRAGQRRDPDLLRAAAAVHDPRARADGRRARERRLHVELPRDRARALRLLLRLLRLRAALPRALPGPARARGVRAGAGRPTRLSRGGARGRAGRRRLPARALGAGAVRPGRRCRTRRMRRRHPLRPRASDRRARARAPPYLPLGALARRQGASATFAAS